MVAILFDNRLLISETNDKNYRLHCQCNDYIVRVCLFSFIKHFAQKLSVYHSVYAHNDIYEIANVLVFEYACYLHFTN